MKKLILILALTFLAGSLFAAEMEEWTWEDYKVSFQVPSDFKVLKSDDKQFSASNANIRMTIFPVKGKAITAEKLVDNLVKWVDQNKIVYDAEKDLDVIEDLNGYLCAYVIGVKEAKQVFGGLIVNPADFSIRLYVLITYKQDDYDTGLAMLKSFTPQ